MSIGEAIQLAAAEAAKQDRAKAVVRRDDSQFHVADMYDVPRGTKPTVVCHPPSYPLPYVAA